MVSKYKMKLVVPKQLIEATEYQDANINTKDNMAWFCFALIHVGGWRVFEEFAQVPVVILNKFLRDKAVKQTRELLEKCGIIECDHVFSFQIPGQEEALSYRFSEDIRRRDFKSYEPVSKAGKDRLAKMRKDWTTSAAKWNAPIVAKQVDIKGNVEPIHTDLVQMLPRFHLPPKPVEMFLPSLSARQRAASEWPVKQIWNKDYYAVVTDAGRLYTPMTNLRKEFRYELLADGKEPLAEVDVKCCQPSLLGYIMDDGVDQDEVERYREFVASGELYEHLMKFTNCKKATVKDAVIKFLCRNWNEGELRIPKNATAEKIAVLKCIPQIRDWYGAEYPGIWAWLKRDKNDEKHLAKFNTRERVKAKKTTRPFAISSYRLQKMESEIVIGDCCRQLIDKNPGIVITPIHDCIVVQESKVDEVYAEMMAAFKRRNVRVQLSMKLYKEKMRGNYEGKRIVVCGERNKNGGMVTHALS